MASHVFSLNSDPTFTRVELTELDNGDFKVLELGSDNITDAVYDAIVACHTADMAGQAFELPEGWAMLAVKTVTL